MLLSGFAGTDIKPRNPVLQVPLDSGTALVTLVQGSVPRHKALRKLKISIPLLPLPRATMINGFNLMGKGLNLLHPVFFENHRGEEFNRPKTRNLLSQHPDSVRSGGDNRGLLCQA